MNKKALAMILLVTGFALVFHAIFTERWNNHKEGELRGAFENSVLQSGISDNDSSDSNIDQAVNQGMNMPQGEVSAIVAIPRVELEVAMIEGIDMDKLNYAVEHFSETANPGEKGNFVVAGHNNWIAGAFFARLDELEYGDKIYIKTRNFFYTYSVTKSFIVEPQDIWVLEPTDEPAITLVTCTIGGKKRLIVRGELELSQKAL